MNTIQNYGMVNYQIGFQSRGKKATKTLADVIKKQKPISREQQILNRIINLLNKTKNLKCTYNKDHGGHEGIIKDLIQ